MLDLLYCPFIMQKRHWLMLQGPCLPIARKLLFLCLLALLVAGASAVRLLFLLSGPEAVKVLGYGCTPMPTLEGLDWMICLCCSSAFLGMAQSLVPPQLVKTMILCRSDSLSSILLPSVRTSPSSLSLLH